MPVSLDLLKDLGVLNIGREPDWQPTEELESGASDDPPSGTDGINLARADGQTAVLTNWSVEINRDAKFPTVKASITAVDDTATYTVTINATPFAYVASVNDTAILIAQGLETLIDAGAEPVTSSVSATGELFIVSDTTATFTTAVGATGTGAMTKSEDATTVNFELWGRRKGTLRWVRFPNGIFATETENIGDRAITAGFDRFYLRITSTDGHVEKNVGPCVIEGELDA